MSSWQNDRSVLRMQSIKAGPNHNQVFTLDLVAAGYSNLPVYLIILCSASSLLCGCSPCRRLVRFRSASPPSTCGLGFCDPLWALAASFISLFPVISVWRTIYLLQTYSFLQGMNKLRRSLNAKPCCKISMPDKYIGFHPIVVWQNSEKWTFPVWLRSLLHETQDTR